MDIVSLNATRLDSSISDGKVNIHNYDLLRNDLNPSGGAVALYIKQHLYIIKGLTSTSYHPIFNGLVERWNQTLKSMLKWLCQD